MPGRRFLKGLDYNLLLIIGLILVLNLLVLSSASASMPDARCFM